MLTLLFAQLGTHLHANSHTHTHARTHAHTQSDCLQLVCVCICVITLFSSWTGNWQWRTWKRARQKERATHFPHTKSWWQKVSYAVLCLEGKACEVVTMVNSHCTRDSGWFFKPQRFATKLTLLKKETLQLSNATNFSSIRQETTKLQEFKVERFANKFVTVTAGKDPVRRHKRLDFPPWQRFICIYTGMSPTVIHITGACMAVQRSADLLLFALQFSQALALFLVCLDRTRKNPCTERSRLEWFRKTLAMGELSRDQVQLLPIRTQGWVVVNFGVVVRLGSKTHGLVDPTIATQVHVPVSPAQPVAWLSKILWCEDFRCSAEVLCWPKKVASRHDKQAETDLAIQFAWRRWLRHRLSSANTFAPRFASAEFAETWYPD